MNNALNGAAIAPEFCHPPAHPTPIRPGVVLAAFSEIVAVQRATERELLDVPSASLQAALLRERIERLEAIATRLQQQFCAAMGRPLHEPRKQEGGAGSPNREHGEQYKGAAEDAAAQCLASHPPARRAR